MIGAHRFYTDQTGAPSAQLKSIEIRRSGNRAGLSSNPTCQLIGNADAPAALTVWECKSSIMTGHGSSDAAMQANKWPEPNPPVPHSLSAQIDPAIEQQVFDSAQRQEEPYVQHHHQADHCRQGVEATQRTGGLARVSHEAASTIPPVCSCFDSAPRLPANGASECVALTNPAKALTGAYLQCDFLHFRCAHATLTRRYPWKVICRRRETAYHFWASPLCTG